MVDSARVSNVVEQIKTLTAADMKNVARFGKVKGYSNRYKDLKESIRSLISMASNVHDIDLNEQFKNIGAIKFTGMIPNEAFNSERRLLVDLGERLVEALELRENEASSPASESTEPAAAPASAESSTTTLTLPPPSPRIYISEPTETVTTSDLKSCLVTADCEPVATQGPANEEDYAPLDVIERMKSCQGALICLVYNPEETGKDASPAINAATVSAEASAAEKKPVLVSTQSTALKTSQDSEQSLIANAQAEAVRRLEQRKKALLVKYALVELGVALSLFPNRVFFVVQSDMISEVPEAFHSFISFQTTGDKLSFEEGQRMVQAFKRSSWSE